MSEPNANAIPSTRAANRSRTHKLTISAMLSGVAFLLMFIEFPIPALIPAFVKLDVSDLPELLLRHTAFVSIDSKAHQKEPYFILISG